MAESAPTVPPLQLKRSQEKIYSKALMKMLVFNTALALAATGAFLLLLEERDPRRIILFSLLFVILGWIMALVNSWVMNTTLRRFLVGLAEEMAQMCGLTPDVKPQYHIDQAIRNFLLVFRRVLGAFQDKSDIVKRVAAVSKVTLAESTREIERLRQVIIDLEQWKEKIDRHRQHWQSSRQQISDLIVPGERLLRLSVDPQQINSLLVTSEHATDLVNKLREFVDKFNQAATTLRDEAGYWQRLPELLEQVSSQLNKVAWQLASGSGGDNDTRLREAEGLRVLADEVLQQASQSKESGATYTDCLLRMEKIIFSGREILHQSGHELAEAAQGMKGTIECIDAHRQQLQEIFGAMQEETVQLEVGEMLMQTITALQGNEDAANAMLQGLQGEIDNLERIREVTESISPIIEELNEIMFDFSSSAKEV